MQVLPPDPPGATLIGVQILCHGSSLNLSKAHSGKGAPVSQTRRLSDAETHYGIVASICVSSSAHGVMPRTLEYLIYAN